MVQTDEDILRTTIREMDLHALTLAASLRGLVRCAVLHHRPGEYHVGGAPCPAEARVKEALRYFDQRKQP